MSYNIIASKTLESDCKIKCSVLHDLLEELDGNTPENCFLDNFKRMTSQDIKDDKRYVKASNFSWEDTGSGSLFDILTGVVLPKFEGTAKIRYTWEDGETTTLLLKDGVVTTVEES